jgi:hypothetical protein
MRLCGLWRLICARLHRLDFGRLLPFCCPSALHSPTADEAAVGRSGRCGSGRLITSSSHRRLRRFLLGSPARRLRPVRRRTEACGVPKIGSHLQIRIFWERAPKSGSRSSTRRNEDDKGPRRHISVVTSPNERGVLVSARACATACMSTVSLSPFLAV